MPDPLPPSRFPLGQIVATPGAIELAEAGVNLLHYLSRHAQCDWGDLDPHDTAANDRALQEGARLFSAYETKHGKLWLITEADRSATTFLRPHEY